jgi:hypothetical protein
MLSKHTSSFDNSMLLDFQSFGIQLVEIGNPMGGNPKFEVIEKKNSFALV